MIDLFKRLFRQPEAATPVAPAKPSAADFIAPFEGFRAAPYMPTQQDRPTIGFGTTCYPDGKAVTLADPPCTQEQALKWLAFYVRGAETAVFRLVKVPLTEGQRVALVSFVYNLGVGAFERSTLRELLNKGRYGDAAREFARWNLQKGKELPGLTKRRAAETALFLS